MELSYPCHSLFILHDFRYSVYNFLVMSLQVGDVIFWQFISPPLHLCFVIIQPATMQQYSSKPAGYDTSNG